MIELRWLNGIDEEYHNGLPTGIGEKYRVLQYRTKNVHVDSSTTKPVGMAWSEWMDVPEVEQD